MGVGMWVFCFIYTSFELSDYAYDVCDRVASGGAIEHKGALETACTLTGGGRWTGGSRVILLHFCGLCLLLANSFVSESIFGYSAHVTL